MKNKCENCMYYRFIQTINIDGKDWIVKGCTSVFFTGEPGNSKNPKKCKLFAPTEESIRREKISKILESGNPKKTKNFF